MVGSRGAIRENEGGRGKPRTLMYELPSCPPQTTDNGTVGEGGGGGEKPVLSLPNLTE